MRPADLRRRLSRLTRRRRRPLAAVLAGLAVLIGLSSLRSPEPAASEGIAAEPSLHAGEVAIPVVLASAALAATLAIGDVVDVIGTPRDDGTAHDARIVAPRARVLDVPSTGSGFGSSASAVVLLAIREALALPLSAALADDVLTVVIRPRADRE